MAAKAVTNQTGKEKSMLREFTGYKKGVNLGGWLSQCEHSAGHYDSFITESDIAEIASWGVDHVRLPIDYELVRSSDGKDLEAGYRYIDKCLEWCEKHKLNMILDLHKTAGYVFDSKINSFFDSPELQNEFVSLWEELAKRYGNLSNRLCFELLNEVVDTEVADQWNDISLRAVKAIRKHADRIRIIIGGVRNNSVLFVDRLGKPFDENIVYTFHYYEPLIFTHQGAYWIDTMPQDFRSGYPLSFKQAAALSEKYLPAENCEFLDFISSDNTDSGFIRSAFKKAVDYAEKMNVPLYCGEYGVIDRADCADALKWLKDLNEVFSQYDISRAIWTYRSKDFGITDSHYAPIFEKIKTLL